MERKAWVAVFLLLILGTLSPWRTPAARAQAAQFTLAIPEEAPALQEGMPVLVAGVWHDLRLSGSGDNWSVVLVLPGAAGRDETSYYQWGASSAWRDVAYDHFLDPTNSSFSGDGFVLRLAVDTTATTGMWHLTVSGGSGVVVDTSVAVIEAKVSASWSGDDFALRVDPYAATTVDAKALGESFKLYNQGNVPLVASASFDHYGEILQVTGLGGILGVGRGVTGSLTLRAPAWSPRQINLKAIVEVHAAYAAPPRSGTRLLPKLEVPFGLAILVAHEGESLGTLGNTTFEWPRLVKVPPDGRVDFSLYFDGSEDVEVTFIPQGARILSLDQGGIRVHNPVLVSLSPGVESPLRVQALLTDRRIGRIDFVLRSLATSLRVTFNTTLEAEGEFQPPGEPVNAGVASGTVALATVGVGAVAYATRSQWAASRRRRPTSRPPAKGRQGGRARGGRKRDRS